MTDVPDEAPGVGEGAEKGEGTPGLLGDALPPLLHPKIRMKSGWRSRIPTMSS
ncbi:hypothetical protein ACIPY2_10655 [Paenarthrobacter sp. NPDC089675]|uniref:hypothetical protein n=1 Tax=Paenarthrobacter sp. NPDC089675 TaxID=3364376 RepID=UPI0038136E46